MSDTKHTPTSGPWSIEQPVRRGAWIYGPDGYVALTCGNTDEEAEANARLIAAAPDLLAALEMATEMLVRYSTFFSLKGPIETALAKARGQVAP